MNNFMPEEIRDAANKIGGDWIKPIEFDGDGLVLQVAKPLEKVKSQYGADEGDFMVNNGLLEIGESFRFTFTSIEGKERKIDTTSAPFFIAFKQVEELGVGDWVQIKRTGKTDKTRYSVEKMEAPDNAVSPLNSEEVSPKDIPF